jgi:hypothetical protein
MNGQKLRESEEAQYKGPLGSKRNEISSGISFAPD